MQRSGYHSTLIFTGKKNWCFSLSIFIIHINIYLDTLVMSPTKLLANWLEFCTILSAQQYALFSEIRRFPNIFKCVLFRPHNAHITFKKPISDIPRMRRPIAFQALGSRSLTIHGGRACYYLSLYLFSNSCSLCDCSVTPPVFLCSLFPFACKGPSKRNRLLKMSWNIE